MKRKSFILSCVFMMGLVACAPSEEPQIAVSNKAEGWAKDTTVTFHFGYSCEVHPMTRSGLSDIISRLDLWISDGSTMYDVHQSTTDASFGSVSFTLDITKTYTLYAIGHKADAAATLTDGVISFPDDKVKDTFWYTTTFSPADAVTLNCEMRRIIGQVRIVTTDPVPQEATKFSITIHDSHDRWSLTDGATHKTDRNATFENFSRKQDGTAVFSINAFASDTQTLHTVTATAYDASDNIIQQRTFTDIPLRNGYRTVLQGMFFTATGMSMSFTADADWSSFDTITF